MAQRFSYDPYHRGYAQHEQAREQFHPDQSSLGQEPPPPQRYSSTAHGHGQSHNMHHQQGSWGSHPTHSSQATHSGIHNARPGPPPTNTPNFENQMRNMILRNTGNGSGGDQPHPRAQPNAENTGDFGIVPGEPRSIQAQPRQALDNRFNSPQSPNSKNSTAAGSVYSRNLHSQFGPVPDQGGFTRDTGTRHHGYDSPRTSQHQYTSGAHMRDPRSTSNNMSNRPRRESHPVRDPANNSRNPVARNTGPPPGSRAQGGRRFFEHSHKRFSPTPPRHQANYLDELVAQNVPYMRVHPNEERNYSWLQQHLSKLVTNALQACQDELMIPLESIKLECFGSLASGFGMADSDMDLMVFYDVQNLSEQQQMSIPRIIEKTLLDAGHGARLLTRTRVPIIRFCSDPSQDLLIALRTERAKWEEEKDKLPEHYEDANKDVDKAEQSDAGEEDGGEDDTNDTNSDDVGLSDEEKQQTESQSAGDGQITPRTNSDPTDKEKKGVKKKRKGRKKKSKGTQESELPKDPMPPPYKNDKERIEMYLLAIKEDWYTPGERGLIEAFIAAFTNASEDPDDENVKICRQALDGLPDVLSRYREPKKRKQELEFPSDSGMLCDINFSTGAHSNPLAVHNTRLQRCYSLFDPRIKQMVLFVKGWVKRRNINKPYHGTLSSYGYVLMVLHYVINIAEPPLAPNLQLLHARNALSAYPAPETCGQFDVRFWQDPDAIRQAASVEYGNNTQSVGSLLVGFFRYYAVFEYRGVKGFEWMKEVISLRTPGGLLTKQDKGWTGKWTQSTEADDEVAKSREITHRYLLAIEDPFEHDHNVARPVMHHGIVAIREEFRRANQLIINGGLVNNEPAGFFDLGKEHVREHRYFGLNPKHVKEKPAVFGPKNLTGEARLKANEKAAKSEESREATNEIADQQNVAENSLPRASVNTQVGLQSKEAEASNEKKQRRKTRKPKVERGPDQA